MSQCHVIHVKWNLMSIWMLRQKEKLISHSINCTDTIISLYPQHVFLSPFVPTYCSCCFLFSMHSPIKNTKSIWFFVMISVPSIHGLDIMVEEAFASVSQIKSPLMKAVYKLSLTYNTPIITTIIIIIIMHQWCVVLILPPLIDSFSLSLPLISIIIQSRLSIIRAM